MSHCRMPSPIRSLVAACALALVGGCASTTQTQPTSPAMVRTVTASDWKLTGSRIIACCCNTPCPCRMNYKPTHCHGCDNTTAVHIDKGDIDGVKMDGLTWVITARVFGEDQSKNWNYVYVSDKATDEQVAALTAMLEEGGQAIGEKGPYLMGVAKGMRKVPIKWEVSSDKREWNTEIPGVLTVKTRSIILPGHDEPVRSSGIFDDYGDQFIHADCVAHTYNDKQAGYQWELKGRQCNQADFNLTSAQVARGGLGWGCWSAHADLGDAKKTQYQEKVGDHK